MRVSNAVYKKLKMDWKNITLPLRAGTPVSAEGVVANTSDAIGMIPENITTKPLMKTIYVLVGGDVDIDFAEAAYGSTISDAAKEAMAGIRFYNADGSVYMPTPEPPLGALVVEGEEDETTGDIVMNVSFNDVKEAFIGGRAFVYSPSEGVLTPMYVVQIDSTEGSESVVLTAGEETLEFDDISDLDEPLVIHNESNAPAGEQQG